MQTLLNLFSVAGIAFVVAVATGGVGDTSSNPDRSGNTRRISRTIEKDKACLGSHARSKVVQYFATYQADPFGLPPDCASKVDEGIVPATWTVPGFSRGALIPEADRPALVEIPAELVKVLPTNDSAVRYYLAGSHLVAVDSGYRILDTIPIPTVRLSDDDAHASSGSTQLVRHVRHSAR